MIIPPPKAKLQPLGPVLAELLTDERYSDRQVLIPNLRPAEEVYKFNPPLRSGNFWLGIDEGGRQNK